MYKALRPLKIFRGILRFLSGISCQSSFVNPRLYRCLKLTLRLIYSNCVMIRHFSVTRFCARLFLFRRAINDSLIIIIKNDKSRTYINNNSSGVGGGTRYIIVVVEIMMMMMMMTTTTKILCNTVMPLQGYLTVTHRTNNNQNSL